MKHQVNMDIIKNMNIKNREGKEMQIKSTKYFQQILE